MRTLDVKSPNYAVSDFELFSRIAPVKSRGRSAEIFAYLKTRILQPARWVVSVPESLYFGEIQINVFPVLPHNKNDRNCTEMNNLLVSSHSLTGKMKYIEVKTNHVTIYGRSANL